MKLYKRFVVALLAAFLPGLPTLAAFAQTLNNSAISGKYFFRHVQLTTNSSGGVIGASSLSGTMIFDGQGKFTFQAQQTLNNSAVIPTGGGAGTYTVQPTGFVSLTNPQQPLALLNARLGVDAIVGSSTDTLGTSDLFIAVPAPTAAVSNAALQGVYRVATLSFPSGDPAQVRNTLFTWNSSGGGTFNPITVFGHAANIPGQFLTQTITGATYTIAPDGTGRAAFPAAVGTGFLTTLFGGNEAVYVSADGNIILGGSLDAGVHDVVIAVKAVGNSGPASLQGLFYTAGMQVGGQGVTASAGSLNSRDASSLLFYERFHSPQGSLDFTGVHSYALNSDGTGTLENLGIALGAGSASYLSAGVNQQDLSSFQIEVGIAARQATGTGVFVRPTGIVDTASFSPAGDPLAPGELFSIFGSGLAPQSLAAGTLPLSPQLGGVQVLVNNKAAPLIFVSDTQINAIVPIATSGSSVSVTVNNNGALSTPVSVPFANTSPGIFTFDLSGAGAGAILHSGDYSAVTAASPAVRGETVLIYATGLGLTTPGVPDQIAAGADPPSVVNANLTVTIGGVSAPMVFKGLAPGFSGLYQLNVTIPSATSSGPHVPLAISTPDSFNNQADIAIQ